MLSPLLNLLLLSAGAATAAAGAAPPRAHELDASYNFEAYLAHFGKAYPDHAEYARRAATFDRHLEEILVHNAAQAMDEDGHVLKGYVMGVNALTDVEVEELPLGYNKLLHPAWRGQLQGGAAKTARALGATDADTDTTTSYSVPVDFEMQDVGDLPAEVDWAAKGKVNPVVPSQGGCGSCWAFAAIAVVESQLAIEHGDEPFVTLSQQTMLTCTPNPEQCGGKGQCDGATVEIALNYIANLHANDDNGGLYTTADVPYTGSGNANCAALTEGKNAAASVEGWTLLPTNDYRAVMNALATKGPLAIAVGASGWGGYSGGVFSGGGATVNHAVLLVGYGETAEGEKFWKVRNSWGSDFGEAGYIRLARSDDDDVAAKCAEDNDPLVGIACALDEQGNQVDVQPVQVCGESAILFDVSYPTGVVKLG